MTLVSRRSALAGVAAVLTLAACTNADGTKMTTRQVLQNAVRIAKGAVSFATILITGYESNCTRQPTSSLCTNPIIVAAVATGKLGLAVLSDALQVASAALADNTSTDQRLGDALGNLLASQDDVQKLIDALANKKTAQRYRLDLDEVRFQAQRIGVSATSLALLPQ